MKHDLKEPCKECPYVGNFPGWIGEHESPQEFVDYVRADIPLSCHMTVSQPCGPRIPASKEQHCAGYALFMNKRVQLSRRRELADMQRRLKTEGCNTEILYPAEVLIQHHTLTK